MTNDSNKCISLSAAAKKTRSLILDCLNAAGASHIASAFSAVDIYEAVYSMVDIEKIRTHQIDRDRIVVSKGHSASALYVVLHTYGLIDADTLATYHKNGSILSGHVSHFVPFVEHSTGALGHGLSVSVGMAIGLRTLKSMSTRVFVVTGDSEMHEGSNWEALMLAGHLQLNNLCVLIDNNNLGGIGETDRCCSIRTFSEAIRCLGFEVYSADGHDREEIRNLISSTEKSLKPVLIVCNTIKGKGVTFMEGNNAWHYRPPVKDDYTKAKCELCGGQ